MTLTLSQMLWAPGRNLFGWGPAHPFLTLIVILGLLLHIPFLLLLRQGAPACLSPGADSSFHQSGQVVGTFPWPLFWFFLSLLTHMKAISQFYTVWPGGWLSQGVIYLESRDELQGLWEPLECVYQMSEHFSDREIDSQKGPGLTNNCVSEGMKRLYHNC